MTNSIEETATVLVIEDKPDLKNYYELNGFPLGTVMHFALTLAEGRRLFYGHQESLDMIIMDGRVDRPFVETLELLREIREFGFARPILTSSNGYKYRIAMIEAGCDQMIKKVFQSSDLECLYPEIFRSISL
ncbi:MAG: hypothetical protein WCI47_03545 [bacterium]